jgi:amidase
VLDPEVETTIEAFAAELAGEGVEVKPMGSPVDAAVLLSAYQVLLGSIIGVDLPAGQARGLRMTRPLAKLARGLGASTEGWTGLTLAYTASHAEWIEADETRARLAQQMRGIFERVDVIIAPITPVAAFLHDHRPFQKRTLRCSDGSKVPYTAMLRWIALATACGLPATAIPAGQTGAGLPVGVQIIGPRGADSRTLAVAEAIEDRLGGFIPPPKPEEL